MLSNGMYAKYKTLDNKEEVMEFINEGTPLFSNHQKDWKAHLDRLVTYRNNNLRKYNKGNYRNIYAHCIRIAIPKSIDKENYREFVKKYVVAFDKRFIKLLWIAKLCQVGDGNYADIMLFEREVYNSPKTIKKIKYDQDYYYNKNTGKRCKENDPCKVLKHKKGDVKLDKDGKRIREVHYVKPKVERIFVYRSFSRFSRKLSKKVMDVAKKYKATEKFYQVISKVTLKEEDSKKVRKSKIHRNDFIQKLNARLIEYQVALEKSNFGFDEKQLKETFKKFLSDVNDKVYKHYEQFNTIFSFMNEWWIDTIVENQ